MNRYSVLRSWLKILRTSILAPMKQLSILLFFIISPFRRTPQKILRTIPRFPNLGTALTARLVSGIHAKKRVFLHFSLIFLDSAFADRAVPNLGNWEVVRKIFKHFLCSGEFQENPKLPEWFMRAKIDVRKIFDAYCHL